MQPGSREFKEKLDRHLTTPPDERWPEEEPNDEQEYCWVTDIGFILPDDGDPSRLCPHCGTRCWERDSRPTKELTYRCRKLQGDLRMYKDYNDAAGIHTTKLALRKVEAELAQRRIERKRERANATK